MIKRLLNLNARKTVSGLCVAFSIIVVAACCVGASAQTISNKTAKLMIERANLDLKRGVAYHMGFQIGYAIYQAEVTQTEYANPNSKIYGAALNLRTAAIGSAAKDAEAINSVLSVASDRLDIKQFSQYSDGISHEKDALAVAKGIQLNLETKLGMIHGLLHDAFMLAYACGYAEANATGGEPRRKHVAAYLELSNYYSKKMKIYNAAGGTLTDLAKGKTPIGELYPKIVILRQSYGSAVADIK